MEDVMKLQRAVDELTTESQAETLAKAHAAGTNQASSEEEDSLSGKGSRGLTGENALHTHGTGESWNNPWILQRQPSSLLRWESQM